MQIETKIVLPYKKTTLFTRLNALWVELVSLEKISMKTQCSYCVQINKIRACEKNNQSLKVEANIEKTLELDGLIEFV